MKPISILICLDGTAQEYIDAAATPSLDRIAREGWHKQVKGIVPSVTNVNNSSLVTGEAPRAHGVTTNFIYDRKTRAGDYLESHVWLCCPTVFERIAARNGRSAMLTSKDKLRTLLAEGTHFSCSVEAPAAWLEAELGPAPDIYTVEANWWLFEAAQALLQREPDFDFIYLSTTDYVQHTYAPAQPEAIRHTEGVDYRLGQLLNDCGERARIIVTADHGMQAKSRGLDFNRLFAEAGLDSEAVPIIKDKHVIHHNNMGGAIYVWCHDGQIERVRDLLLAEEGVTEVLTRAVACARFGLMPERVGDLMVLGDEETVFGTLEAARVPMQNLRSHGGPTEAVVPFYAWHFQADPATVDYSYQAVHYLLKDFY
jgi:phosphonoacetate hydrolase